MSPVRLYLAAAVVFFLVWPNTGFASGLEEFIQGFIDARGAPSLGATDSSAQFGAQIITESLPGLLILFFVPFFAAMLWALNRGDGAFVRHLVMAFHLHTVFFAGIVATAPINLLLGDASERLGEPVLFVALFSFLCASIGRVYELSPLRSIGRSLVLLSAYSVVAAITVAAMLSFLL